MAREQVEKVNVTCDRCERHLVLNRLDPMKSPPLGVVHIQDWSDGINYTNRSVDLCAPCLRLLKDFLDGMQLDPDSL